MVSLSSRIKQLPERNKMPHQIFLQNVMVLMPYSTGELQQAEEFLLDQSQSYLCCICSVNIEITVDWEQTIDGVSDLLNLLNENGELQNISFNLDSTPREALEYFELLNSSWTGSAQEDAMVSALQSIFGTDVSRPDFEAEVGGILNETLETPDPNLIVDRFVNLLLGTNESDSNGSPIDQWNLSELGARLNSTTFNFNQTIIANEAGNILSSDEAVSTIVSSGVEALFGLADDDSDILAIMMVWVIVEADNALQEGVSCNGRRLLKCVRKAKL